MSPAAPRGRCAVVSGDESEDGSLTIVYLLQRMGFQVEVLGTLRHRLRNPFVHAGRHKPALRWFANIERAFAAACRERFDLVVIDSFEGRAALDCASQLLLDTAVLGLVNDGRHAEQSPNYQFHLAHPHCQLLALAPGPGAQTTAPARLCGTIHPVFFFDRDVGAPPRATQRKRICVQGDFGHAGSESEELLHALRELKSEGRDFECHVTGRTFTRAFRDFAREVRTSRLDGHVRYVRRGLGCSAYYRLLNGVDFMLPLVDPASHGRAQCSPVSALTVAIGFNLIPLASIEQVGRYGLEDAAFIRDGDLRGVLRAALDAPADDLALRRARLARTRQRLLEDSARDLAGAIERVSRVRGPALRPPDLRPVESLAG